MFSSLNVFHLLRYIFPSLLIHNHFIHVSCSFSSSAKYIHSFICFGEVKPEIFTLQENTTFYFNYYKQKTENRIKSTFEWIYWLLLFHIQVSKDLSRVLSNECHRFILSPLIINIGFVIILHKYVWKPQIAFDSNYLIKIIVIQLKEIKSQKNNDQYVILPLRVFRLER